MATAFNYNSPLQGTGLGPVNTPFSPTSNATKVQSTNYVSQYSLNNHLHDIELFIVNNSGIYPIAPTAIVALTIENSLSNWVLNGDLTVYYNNELAEHFGNGFNFRNDGEDILRLRLVPVDLKIPGKSSLNLSKEIWEINCMFSIYNMEDVTVPGGGNSQADSLKKYRKFHFWDIRYQKMLAKNIEYSTATSDLLTFNKGLKGTYSDDSRSLDTNLAIYDIIKKSLNNDKLLSKTGAEQDPANNWEQGATKVFYTSPVGSNAYEDLMYVYSRHVSESGKSLETVHDYSILDIERGDGDLGHFTLRPLSKYFEKSTSNGQPGEYQLEHFFLQANVQSTGIGLYRAPINTGTSTTRDIKLKGYNSILKYEFIDIAPVVNSKVFVTTPVYSVDFKKRQFNVEFKNNSVNTAKKFFEDNYINSLFKRSAVLGNTFLLDQDTDEKTKNLSINPIFSLYGDSASGLLRNPDGIHQLIRTGLFQNTCINFTTLGLTMREPGTFIAIDRPEGSKDNTIDDKLCGQWFVINVMHTITNGAYYNNITAVKINRYQPLPAFNNAQNFNNLQQPFVNTPTQPTTNTAPLPNNANNFNNLNRPFQQ